MKVLLGILVILVCDIALSCGCKNTSDAKAELKRLQKGIDNGDKSLEDQMITLQDGLEFGDFSNKKYLDCLDKSKDPSCKAKKKKKKGKSKYDKTKGQVKSQKKNDYKKVAERLNKQTQPINEFPTNTSPSYQQPSLPPAYVKNPSPTPTPSSPRYASQQPDFIAGTIENAFQKPKDEDIAELRSDDETKDRQTAAVGEGSGGPALATGNELNIDFFDPDNPGGTVLNEEDEDELAADEGGVGLGFTKPDPRLSLKLSQQGTPPAQTVAMIAPSKTGANSQGSSFGVFSSDEDEKMEIPLTTENDTEEKRKEREERNPANAYQKMDISVEEDGGGAKKEKAGFFDKMADKLLGLFSSEEDDEEETESKITLKPENEKEDETEKHELAVKDKGSEEDESEEKGGFFDKVGDWASETFNSKRWFGEDKENTEDQKHEQERTFAQADPLLEIESESDEDVRVLDYEYEMRNKPLHEVARDAHSKANAIVPGLDDDSIETPELQFDSDVYGLPQ